jgi:lipoprotein-releasing system permease protein
LKDGEFGIVLGGELARALGVALGEKITLIAPQGQVTPAGVVPRLKQFTVIGTFDSGHYEYDSALALVHIGDAQRLFRIDGPTGVRLRISDMQRASEVASQLVKSLPPMRADTAAPPRTTSRMASARPSNAVSLTR